MGSGSYGRPDRGDGQELTVVRDGTEHDPTSVVCAADPGRPAAIAETRGDAAVAETRGDPAVAEGPFARPAPPPPSPPAFSDRDLRPALDRHDGRLIVYVWSPHMPLSVDGYAEIVGAARSLDLAVEPVLFAGGNGDFARREAERVGIPARGLREVGVAELVLRDAQVHAPSVVVCAEGRVSPVLPGHRNADGYRRYLERLLGL